MPNIVDIEGIGETFTAKLKGAGVVTTEKLLEVAGTKKGRDELAKKTGLTTKQILEWVNRADLYRIKGIGSEYSDLLEVAGVDTVVELATRKPDNLLAKMTEVNATKKLVRKLPTAAAVEDWVAQAKKLPKKVEY